MAQAEGTGTSKVKKYTENLRQDQASQSALWATISPFKTQYFLGPKFVLKSFKTEAT